MFDFLKLKQGTLLKRKSWEGYWKWENETIMMYCKDGRILDIRKTDNVDFTVTNMLSNDWEEATEKNCSIILK